MKTNIDLSIPAEIKVSADLFAKYKDAKGRESAAKWEADAVKKLMGLPDTASLVAQLGLTKKNPRGEVVIKDGNSVPIGKISVFWKDPYEVDGNFCSRVT